MRPTVGSVFACVTVLALLTACSDNSNEVQDTDAPPTVVEMFAADTEALARGEALYRGSCAGYCHALADGASTENNDAVFLFDCQWKHGGSDDEIFKVVGTGVPGTRMVPYGNNFPEGDDDIWKLIAYLRTNQQPCS